MITDYRSPKKRENHEFWQFVRDLTGLSNDMKLNCVLDIKVKIRQFSMVSLKRVYAYPTYSKIASKSQNLHTKLRCAYEQACWVYELLRWVEIYSPVWKITSTGCRDEKT